MSDIKRTYTEVVREVDRKLDSHSEQLAAINEHLRQLNGSVARITSEIWNSGGLKDRTLEASKDIEQLREAQQAHRAVQKEHAEDMKSLSVERAAEKAAEGSWRSLGLWLLNNMLQPVVIAIVIGMIMTFIN